MQSWDDNALLKQYVERRSEKAFSELVHRHIDKVYSVALRQTGNEHHAQEVTQAVFVVLARKAPKLIKHPCLTGWMFQTARMTSLTLLRGEKRRALREREAHMQSQMEQKESGNWHQVAPYVDQAIASLSAKDREAIVLRFFDGKSMKQIAAGLAVSEEAARKRVERAVEKLRAFLGRRGVVLSAGVLCTALSTGSVQAAPAGLAATVTAAVARESAAASSILVKEALRLMAWAKAKTAATVGVGVLLTAATASVAVHQFNVPFPWPFNSSNHSNLLVTEYGTYAFNEGAITIEVSEGGPNRIDFRVAFHSVVSVPAARENAPSIRSIRREAFPVMQDRWAFCVSQAEDVWLFDGDSRMIRLRNSPEGVRSSRSGSDPTLTGQAPLALKQWITKKKG